MKNHLFSLSGSLILAVSCICSVQTESPCPTENSGICISEFKLWHKHPGKAQAFVELYFHDELEVYEYVLHFETLNRDKLDLSVNYQRGNPYVVFNSTNKFFETNIQRPVAVIITPRLYRDDVLDGIVCGYESASGIRRLGDRFSVGSVIVVDESLSFSRCGGDFVQTTSTWGVENSCSRHEPSVQDDEENDGYDVPDNNDDSPSHSITKHMGSSNSVRNPITSGKGRGHTETSPKPTTRTTTPNMKTTTKAATTKPMLKTTAKGTPVKVQSTSKPSNKHTTKLPPISTSSTATKRTTHATTSTKKGVTTPRTSTTTLKPTHTVSTRSSKKPTTQTTTINQTNSQKSSLTTKVPSTTKTSRATSVRHTTKTTLKPQSSSEPSSVTKHSTAHSTHAQTASNSVSPTEHTTEGSSSSQHTQTPTSVPVSPTSAGPRTTSTRSGTSSSESGTSSSQSASSSSQSGTSTSQSGSSSSQSGTSSSKSGSTSSRSGTSSTRSGSSVTTVSWSSTPGSSSKVTGSVTTTTESVSGSPGSTSKVTGSVTTTTKSVSSSSGSQSHRSSTAASTSSSHPITSSTSPNRIVILINEVNVLLENGRNNTFIELKGPHHMTLVNYSIVVFDGQSKATLFHRRFVENDTFTGSGFFVVRNYKSTGHRKSVVVALFDNTRWMQYYQKNVPTSEPQSLIDSFVVRTTNDALNSEILENMVPTHANRIVAIDSSLLTHRPEMSMSRCQHTIMDPGSFLLSHPTIGQPNNCTLGIGHRVQFKLTNADCHDFENTKLQDELVDKIVEGVNKNCMCGMTQALVTDRKYLCGSLIFEASLEATMSWQSARIFTNYRSFVTSSSSVVVGTRSYITDPSCYRDCLPPPVNPNSGNGGNVTLTVAVVVACVGVFLIVAIGVIIYIRRKKRGIVTFRLTHLGEMDTSTMLHEDRDDLGEDDPSTFKSIALQTT